MNSGALRGVGCAPSVSTAVSGVVHRCPAMAAVRVRLSDRGGAPRADRGSSSLPRGPTLRICVAASPCSAAASP